MKIKVTEKQIKEGYKNIIDIGYCDLQHLLRYFDADYYTAGIYGWNADIYKINYSTCIVTGYRPFGNIYASYNGICKKYDEKAQKLYYKYDNYEKQLKAAEKLLQKFIDEALQLNNK